MFPLGHAAFAYLAYVGVAAATRRPLPVHWALVPLAVGSQFPDLVDKPLSYYGILVSGRSLGHSVITATAVILLVWWAATRVATPDDDRVSRLVETSPMAFAIGYVSHLLADAFGPLRDGAFSDLGFLLYPVVPPIDYPKGDLSPISRVVAVYRDPTGHPQFELILVAAVVFVVLEIRYRRRVRSEP